MASRENFRGTPEERFWKYVKKTRGCWLWTGTVRGALNNQYGAHSVKQKYVLAHRFSYELNKGKIPANLKVCHSCDVNLCVNPAHLWVGTQKENIKDMFLKGRQNPRNGENYGAAKLSWSKVKEMREMKKDGVKQVEIANRFNVSQGTVSMVIKNIIWKI